MVYGVNIRERGNPMAYMKERGLTYGLLLKADGISRAYGVRGLPAYFVIGHDGKVVLSGSSVDERGQIAGAIEGALRQIK